MHTKQTRTGWHATIAEVDGLARLRSQLQAVAAAGTAAPALSDDISTNIEAYYAAGRRHGVLLPGAISTIVELVGAAARICGRTRAADLADCTAALFVVEATLAARASLSAIPTNATDLVGGGGGRRSDSGTGRRQTLSQALAAFDDRLAVFVSLHTHRPALTLGGEAS